MKLAVNLALSLVVLAVCLWLVWPSPEHRAELSGALRSLDLSYLWIAVALLAVVHVLRAWRWNHLLAPLGVTLPFGRLLAISSVGFMAILALPARLGELVRPALVRRRGSLSASAALGTVAVERVLDGVLLSGCVFAAFFALRGPDAPAWMMPTALLALALFAGALVFLGFALRWPDQTCRAAVRLSLLPFVWPRLAATVERKLLAMVGGFSVLRDRRNLIAFGLWTVAYWAVNAASVWVLARGFGLELGWVGAVATMALVGVGISLPNAPALVGQFQWFTQLGLSLYVGEAVGMGPRGLAFAIALHALQVAWYVGAGALALLSPHVSLAEMWPRVAARTLVDDGGGADASTDPDGAADRAGAAPQDLPDDLPDPAPGALAGARSLEETA